MAKRFLQDRQGNLAVTTAFLVVPIMISVAGVIDMTNLNTQNSNLQNALDAAGIAIATKLHTDMTEEELTQLGIKVFQANLDTDIIPNVNFSYPGVDFVVDPDGEVTDVFITVTADMELDSYFSAYKSFDTHRIAKVTILEGDPACILALSETADDALEFDGSSSLNLIGCIAASNSKSASSIARSGAAQINAKCVYASGTTTGIANNANVNLNCAGPMEYRPPVEDPLEDLVMPTPGVCKNGNISNGPHSNNQILPGTYCMNNLNLNGGAGLTLAAGTYIFDGTNISLGGGSFINGTDVTIFLINGASIDFGANAAVNLAAPTTGDYAGVLIYSPVSNTETLSFQGGAATSMTGYIYNAGGHIDYYGNSSSQSSQCMRIVANTITMTGNSYSKSSGCEGALGGIETYGSGYIRLLE